MRIYTKKDECVITRSFKFTDDELLCNKLAVVKAVLTAVCRDGVAFVESDKLIATYYETNSKEVDSVTKKLKTYKPNMVDVIIHAEDRKPTNVLHNVPADLEDYFIAGMKKMFREEYSGNHNITMSIISDDNAKTLSFETVVRPLEKQGRELLYTHSKDIEYYYYLLKICELDGSVYYPPYINPPEKQEDDKVSFCLRGDQTIYTTTVAVPEGCKSHDTVVLAFKKEICYKTCHDAYENIICLDYIDGGEPCTIRIDPSIKASKNKIIFVVDENKHELTFLPDGFNNEHIFKYECIVYRLYSDLMVEQDLLRCCFEIDYDSPQVPPVDSGGKYKITLKDGIIDMPKFITYESLNKAISALNILYQFNHVIDINFHLRVKDEAILLVDDISFYNGTEPVLRTSKRFYICN